MKTIYIILIFLIFISCASNRTLTNEQIVGKYQWNGVYGISSTIELKTNQTFEYKWQAGLISGISFGTWQREGYRIVLNSNLQPFENGIKDFEIIETKKKASDSLLITVIGPDNQSIPFAVCILRRHSITLTASSTDIHGQTRLPNLEADSLLISFVGYKTILYRIDSTVSELVFKMENINEYYEYFTNETWIYRKERLYAPSITKDKSVKKDFYEKLK